MHLLFVLFDFTIVFCFAWDDYVASFCNSSFFVLPRAQVQAVDGTGREQGGPAKQGKQSAQWAVA